MLKSSNFTENMSFFPQSSLHFWILLNLGFQWTCKKCFCKEKVLICYGLLFLLTVWREKFCLSVPYKGCQCSAFIFAAGQSGRIAQQTCPKCFLSWYFKTLEEITITVVHNQCLIWALCTLYIMGGEQIGAGEHLFFSGNHTRVFASSLTHLQNQIWHLFISALCISWCRMFIWPLHQYRKAKSRVFLFNLSFNHELPHNTD